MSAIHTARWTLVAGLAFVFLYLGIATIIQPSLEIARMPAWMDGLASLTLNQWLQVVSIMEILIGAALLCPLRQVQRVAAFLAVLHLTAVLSQLGWNDVAARDVGLLMMATGLWYLLKDEGIVK